VPLRKWNHQGNIQVTLADGAHFVGEMVDPGGDRTLLDELEEFRGLAFGASLHLERRHRCVEVGNLGTRLRPAGAKNRPALRLHHHAVALEAQVTVDDR
jgi:hypothetical protein